LLRMMKSRKPAHWVDIQPTTDFPPAFALAVAAAVREGGSRPAARPAVAAPAGVEAATMEEVGREDMETVWREVGRKKDGWMGEGKGGRFECERVRRAWGALLRTESGSLSRQVDA